LIPADVGQWASRRRPGAAFTPSCRRRRLAQERVDAIEADPIAIFDQRHAISGRPETRKSVIRQQ
jgi:hypothetical protein